MFENIGRIGEAKIKQGKREELEGVVNDVVAETRKKGGTLNSRYYLSDDGDVLVYGRFANAESALIEESLKRLADDILPDFAG